MAWWNDYYTFRRPLTISTKAGTLPSGHRIAAPLDIPGYVSAGKLLSSYLDLEVVFYDGLNYTVLSSLVVADTGVLFPLHEDITSTSEGEYFIYCGNPLLVDVPTSPTYSPTGWDISENYLSSALSYTRPGEHWSEGRSSTKGAIATFAFSGTRVRIVAEKSNSQGKALIRLDKGPWTQVDLYSSTSVEETVFELTSLPATKHTVQMQVSGEKHPSSSGVEINFTSFDYLKAFEIQIGLEEVKNETSWTAANATLSSSAGVVTGEPGPRGETGAQGPAGSSLWVDVMAHLTDPTDPTLTVAEIEALGEQLFNDGGGTLWFAPGEYHLERIEQPADEANDWWFREGPPYYLSEFDMGAIRLRNGVNLVGSPGAKLIWSAYASNSSCIIGCDNPFDDSASAQIIEDVTTGQTQFVVDIDPTGFYEVGDYVQLRLGQVPGDTRECLWWTFGTVTAIDSSSITLDTHAEVDVTISEMFQQKYPTESTGDPAVAFSGQAYDYVEEVLDSFDRADSATTLGTSDSGDVWQYFQPGSGLIGISGNKAYMATSDAYGANIAYLDTGEANQFVKADMTPNGAGGNLGLLVRFDGATRNGYYVFFAGSSIGLLRLDAGAPTAIGLGWAGTVPTTCTLAVICDGSLIRVYLDGVLIIEETEATYTSNTEVGMLLNQSGAYVDNLSAGARMWKNYRAAWIRRFKPNRMIENVTIEGFELLREGGSSGVNSPQSGILLHRCRNVTVKDIKGSNTGTSLFSALETDAVHVENIRVHEANDIWDPDANDWSTGYYGGGLWWAGNKNATGKRLYVSNCQYAGIHHEQRSELHLTDVVIENGNANREANATAVNTFNGAHTTIERLTISGKEQDAVFFVPGPIDTLVVKDLNFYCDNADGLDFSFVEGRMHLKTLVAGVAVDQRYKLRTWQGVFPIPDNNVDFPSYIYTLPIPDGPVHRARLYVSSLTNVNNVAWLSNIGGYTGQFLWQDHSLDATPGPPSPEELEAGKTSELGRSFGGGQAINLLGTPIGNYLYDRAIGVTGSGTVPAGQWGSIELQYFAPDPAVLGSVGYDPDENEWDGHSMASLVDLPGLIDTIGHVTGWS